MSVYIGLGSNLSDPVSQVKTAIVALQQLPVSTVRVISSLYASRPWGGVDDQPDFINAVVKLQTTLSPLQLLEQLQLIEKNQNRTKDRVKWGPRTIDCDILLFDALRLNLPQLTIPHPYLEERAFVVIPLAEIAPQLVLPSGIRIKTLAENLRQAELVQLSRKW